MGKLKNRALEVPAAKRPEHFTYALSAFTVQRRQGHWYVTPAWSAFAGEKPEWRGPFDTIEDASAIMMSLAIAELRRRHATHIASYQLAPEDPLNGDRRAKKRSQTKRVAA